jgi:phosphoglucosamine mutase
MLHGYGIEPALQAGLVATGMNPYLLGPSPEPSVSMHVRTLRATFGLMISVGGRSHDEVAIKFFGSDGLEISKKEMLEIEEQLLDANLSEKFSTGRQWGRAKRVDGAEARYIEHVKKALSPGMTFDGLRVVVDCANGALYKIMEPVLDELGAEVVLVNVDPDGFNINQNCGYNDTRVLVDNVHRVRADAGIGFNGDGSDLVVMTEANHEGSERLLTSDEVVMLLERARNECQKAKELNGSVERDAFMKALQILAVRQRSGKKLSELL